MYFGDGGWAEEFKEKTQGLERREEGSLTLGDLPRGQVRELSDAEIKSLENV